MASRSSDRMQPVRQVGGVQVSTKPARVPRAEPQVIEDVTPKTKPSRTPFAAGGLDAVSREP